MFSDIYLMFNLIIMKKNEKTKSQKAKSLSRRNFISTFGAASAAFTIIPRYTLGGIGYTAPSDLLNIAGIGVGGRGVDDIQAICSPEVDERQLQHITYADESSNSSQTTSARRAAREPVKLANI